MTTLVEMDIVEAGRATVLRKVRQTPAAPLPSASPLLSVVIPVHNETGNIEPLIEEIELALRAAIEFEIVCVDDGSTDRTLACLRTLIPLYPRLRVLHHRTNSGQSKALMTGVQHARGHLIATLDGDGQNDPDDILRMLAYWLDQSGDAPLLVTGLRVRRNDRWLRRWSSGIANWVRRSLLNDHTVDTGCGLKLVERATYLALPYFDHMHRFLPALVLRSGGRVDSMPVKHRPRLHGCTHYGVRNRLWVGLIDLAGVLWLLRRARRTELDVITATDGGPHAE